MTMKNIHNFHIPVMGLAFTIDSPIRVAQFGIDSVISIVDDELMEKMNAFYSEKFNFPYKEITTKHFDFRAERTRSYLNLVSKIVEEKFTSFCSELAENKQSLVQFLQMLPQKSDIKKSFSEFISNHSESIDSLKNFILKQLHPGSIDVNIMTKVDKANFHKKEALPAIFNDAHASLRGFAESNLSSSLVLSAGMNPSLYNYISEFKDFFPDENGNLKKKIILKVSDFRSAMIQGNYLAKKGIWVSEYRIESGLNCGGHAFATDGLLLGPIMQEFKEKKQELIESAHKLMISALNQKEYCIPEKSLPLKITVQGGVGTSEEHNFLIENYDADSIGWGSPFLLVPEATSTDLETRNLLINAKENDFYRSGISPLGVPFNTLKGTTNEEIREHRIATLKAGSSCPKKLLALSREFGEEGICTASRKFQQIKLNDLEIIKDSLSTEKYNFEKQKITEKSCLCVGLANTAYLENHFEIKGEKQGVVICPGPNLAYFDKEVSLYQMLRHIYGYESILNKNYRPNLFIKELQLYVNYLKEEILTTEEISKKILKKWNLFKKNLLDGIKYYEELFASTEFFKSSKGIIFSELEKYKVQVSEIEIPSEMILN
ncbi:hypothetical protein ACFPVY_00595 [Flavobacterium qiangtangense]|uniref:Uncharacterized protein n=1 Tax=Flavobacterium qiangtangense TaxID=1442595 RepID=A0ABW1PI58_9FLAO